MSLSDYARSTQRQGRRKRRGGAGHFRGVFWDRTSEMEEGRLPV